MRRLYIPREREVEIQDIPDTEPAEGEIKVKMSYCGICGSDVHAYKGLHPFVPLPATPGHEGSGIVTALGPGAGDSDSRIKVGDKVTFEPNLVCGECHNCRIGRYNICENLKVMGCQSHGMLQDTFVAPAGKVVKLPSDMSLKDAALTEPLAVGLHAVRRSGIQVGFNVAIIGAGTIGLSVLQFAHLSGAGNIIVSDLIDKRLEIAKQLGATHVVNPKEAPLHEYVKNAKDILGDAGIDIVFECVGVEASMNESLKVVRKGGTIMILGVFGKPVNNFNAAWVQDREFNIKGSLMYTMRDIKDTITAIHDGRVKVTPMITSVVPLDDGSKAFEIADEDAANQVKVLVEINPSKGEG
ncbi:alcohol dehydrogenase catalytic domain-containing protein [Candidatus Bathyarchaeota archaeon]|nr:alcohol dehydrogenase catalytic domain-containing protein [Candidatus Bathyarchaeota archaeon]